MSQANFGVFEQSEFTKFAANVNFLSLRNLASNELFFTSFISLQQPLIFNYTPLSAIIIFISFSLIPTIASPKSSETLAIISGTL